MAAVLKEHPRAISGRLLPKSWRTRTRLAGLVEAISKRFWTQFKITRIDFNAWSYSLCTACAACLALYISFSLKLDESHWGRMTEELAIVVTMWSLVRIALFTTGSNFAAKRQCHV
jgi:hypothetical protein